MNIESSSEPKWQASWVWLDPVQFPGAQHAPVSWWAGDAHREGRLATAGLLRRSFTLTRIPAQVRLRLSADSRYRLWINGHLAGRGPAMVGGSYAKAEAPDWWYYDQLDLGGFLNRGDNVIAVEVTTGPDNQTHFSQGHAGFIAELLDADGNLLLGTDPTWRGLAFAGYRTGPWTGFTRDCDLRAYPQGWQLPGFDDRTWPGLVLDTTRRPPLRAHVLPALAEQFVAPCQGDSLTIPPGTQPVTVRVEFPQMLAGHLQFVAQASVGTFLDFGFEEMPGIVESGSRGLRLTMPGGETNYESPAYFSARALRLTVTFPPRAEPLTLRGLGLLTRSQSVENRGSFACSDPFLTDLWRVCRDTLRLCVQDIHLDSPHHQEALGDHGDYLVEMLMGYYAFGDYALAHVDLERMALDLEQQCGAQFHTSYALLFPDLVADLLQFTGDRATAAAALTAIRMTLGRTLAWRGAEGLLSQAPNYMFVDWIKQAGVNYHHPPAAQGMGALTAFTVRALRRAAWLVRALGADPAEASTWEKQADELATAFREQLFDPERGLFRDGLCGINRQPTGCWLPPDPAQEVFTRHTNILAVWAAIVTGTEAAAVLERALADPALPEPQPYFQHYLFEALDAAGLFPAQARKHLDLWRPMLRDNPHSLREMWTSGDYSHAWGGTPLVQLSQRVLGVEPTEPGWRSIRLRPQPLDLDWAQGVVPTPLGDISIRWERHGTTVTLSASVPDGMAVQAPDGRGGTASGDAGNSQWIFRTQGTDV
jgi:hypothetical protein